MITYTSYKHTTNDKHYNIIKVLFLSFSDTERFWHHMLSDIVESMVVWLPKFNQDKGN